MSMIHPMARTTPRTRAEIHQTHAPLTDVSQTYNVSLSTARKCRNRSDHLDRSHRAHQMNATLSELQELILLEMRRLCLLPLDDLVSVTKMFINADASRTGISRLLRREGMSKLADLVPKQEGEETSKKTFKDYESGYLHIDIKYLPKMPDERSRRCLFVAIDNATRWLFLRTFSNQTEHSSVDFYAECIKPYRFKSIRYCPTTALSSRTVLPAKTSSPRVSTSLTNNARYWTLSTVCRGLVTRRQMAWLSDSTAASVRW